MSRRNDKRNSRRNRQRNNGNEEASKFASMMMGAIMGKAFEEVFGKKDGTPTEIQLPDSICIFLNEEDKPMVYMKNGEEKSTDAEEGKPITYDDICRELFLNKKTYWLDNKKINYLYSDEYNNSDLKNCTSIAQAKRVAAFIKLQNIAKYLNGGWKPDFDGETFNWSIIEECRSYGTQYNRATNDGSVYFKDASLANEAIRLMGKESLDDLFSTDW